jgi:nicotinate-nucleotide pyrophosphorylase (carboxylating)
MALEAATIDQVVRAALAEDVGNGDITTDGVIDADARCSAAIYLEEPGIVCGLPLAAAVFAALDPTSALTALAAEGSGPAAESISLVAKLEGSARAVLTGERTALNLFGRLCGIATLTREYVDAVDGTRTTILDTRKTTPGLRALERYAVRCGGGENHRAGLDDAILVKENHIRLGGGIAAAVAALRGRSNGTPIEVEAETLSDVRDALDAGVERILLDNMTLANVSAAVELVDGRAALEASGGISLDTVRDYAETGVDFISVGALTRAARSLDVSLEIE